MCSPKKITVAWGKNKSNTSLQLRSYTLCPLLLCHSTAYTHPPPSSLQTSPLPCHFSFQSAFNLKLTCYIFRR